MLGYTQPFPLQDNSNAQPFIHNSYICYVPSQNKMMPRHDCKWNETETTALSNPEPNTSNDSDGVTTTEEEFDYSLLGPLTVTDSWDPEAIIRSTIPDVTDQLDREPMAISHPISETFEAPLSRAERRRPAKPTNKFMEFLESQQRSRRTPKAKASANLTEAYVDPKTLTEAFARPDAMHWRVAWQTEMTRLEIRNTWAELPPEEVPDKNPIKSKYTFRMSIRPDGTLKYRVRLVACGYSQIQGADYEDTFAPTAKYRSWCIILQLAAMFGWDIEGIDVELAFLESDVDKLLYLTLPKDVYRNKLTGKPIVVRLLRSLYGLKQAGELWYQFLKTIILQYNFTRLKHDQCVYVKRDLETGDVTIVICYVDDILIIGNNSGTIAETITHLKDNVTNITGGEVRRYVGVDIKRDLERHTISLSQKPYISKFVEQTIPADASSKPTPMPETIDYSKLGDGSVKPIQDVVGKLRYLADRTRPDISTAVGMLGSAAANPTKAHLKGIEHLAGYLKGTQDLALVLGGDDTEVKLFGYTDASHLPDDTSKPRLGYCFFLNLTSGTIFARSVKDSTISHSSCESEIKAIDNAIRMAIWLRGFLEELGFEQFEPTVLHTDSVSAKALADICNIGTNSSHLVMRINYIHECVEAGIISLKYINTLNEVADVLTKLLPVEPHEQHSRFLLEGHNSQEPVAMPDTEHKKAKSDFTLDHRTGKWKHRLNQANQAVFFPNEVYY